MNKDRRKEIADLISRVEELRELVDSIQSDIETVRDDEQDYFDNMPEAFQYADQGQASDNALSSLEESLSGLEDINLDDIVSSLETASE